ncbi:DUF3307 domain-containing protein [Marixanthomonas sp. SCSIO 43207]|uniref:DUF3307 domain-containing protein n=1 Tax=Marixanthomonas sp. SCSIO 43207 TaxID=2779360 RepID=UPI001CA9D37A|nr:DUF3307 domain-containing protein [Marixanthomonas sp. SCSIO 43207]UAB80463.1 DUF3307 domain-containing protein [Marixanthomonas sp. SCSIO 43207]
MEFISFLLLQFLAHILADYFFQWAAMAKQKAEKGFKSGLLIWHILIVFITSWVLSFQLSFIYAAILIAITHYVIDGCKLYISRSKLIGRYAFFIDQALHILVLCLVSWGFSAYQGIHTFFEIPLSTKSLFLIISYLLCLKPANIFIREVFSATEVEVTSDNELPNAGKVIGVLERLLTLTFIVINQYEAVGFLIAAKSILRYRNDETLKTEYVLIGTMLSFGTATILGIITNAF